MNERIRELALQAGFAYEPIKDQLWVGGPIEIMISPGLEKFAELIVKECANLFDKDEMELSLTERTIHKTIKEHFGVEE